MNVKDNFNVHLGKIKLNSTNTVKGGEHLFIALNSSLMQHLNIISSGVYYCGNTETLFCAKLSNYKKQNI